MSIQLGAMFFRGRECAAWCNSTQFKLTVFRPPTWEHFAYSTCGFSVWPLSISEEGQRRRDPLTTVVHVGGRPGQTFELASNAHTRFATLSMPRHRDPGLLIDTQALTRAMNCAKAGTNRDWAKEVASLENAQRRTLLGMGRELSLGSCSQGEFVSVYHQYHTTSPGFG